MEAINKKVVDLYGGALQVTLPTDFRDLSEILPVNDNQEVFTDFKYDAKLIVEVIECLEPNDETAVAANFNEVRFSLINITNRPTRLHLIINTSYYNL